ncbi:MAG TPA: magnesium/cobalt transporter CorA [Candidatus Bathyarchaeia archaeon]
MIVKQTYKGPNGSLFDWVDVENGSVDEITQIAHEFKIHPLCIETILEGGERPRIQDFDDYSFIMLQPITSRIGQQEFGELYVILSKKWVLTFHKDSLKEVEDLRKAMVSGSKAASSGADFLFYSILSRTLESYYDLADNLEGKLEALEEDISETSGSPVLNRTMTLRRDVLTTRRILSYTREVVATMLREDFYDLNDEDERYYRDAHFQLSHLLESVETLREFLSDLRDSYMSSVSLSLNEVMKKLTMVGTIALPLIVVSGVYGMNLQGLPFAENPIGGLIAVILMILFSLSLGLYFRRKRWI